MLLQDLLVNGGSRRLFGNRAVIRIRAKSLSDAPYAFGGGFGKRVYAGLARMNVIAADIALFVSVYDGVQIVDYNIFAGKCFQNGLVIGFDDLVPLGGKARIAFETLVFVGRRGGCENDFCTGGLQGLQNALHIEHIMLERREALVFAE